MPTVIAHHDVKDTDHWLASPRREEFFGPLGVTNIRTFVDPQNPNRVGILLDVPDIDALLAGLNEPQREAVTGPCFAMRVLTAQMHTDAKTLRVFVATHGPASLKTARGTVELAHGDVIVAEPADGDLRLGSGQVMWVGVD